MSKGLIEEKNKSFIFPLFVIFGLLFLDPSIKMLRWMSNNVKEEMGGDHSRKHLKEKATIINLGESVYFASWIDDAIL